MTCAKVVVTAELHLPDGSVWIGSNRCYKPQDSCLRVQGEGYDKCKSICEQPFHAEVDAMTTAERYGKTLDGGKMIVYHKRVCDSCQEAMALCGVTWELA
jgi:deoxycytidylate deaminase